MCDAAIVAFAAQGFDVSLRAIAARAGFTTGLVRHHFGSKEALRAECDATVLERYRRMKEDSLEASPPAGLQPPAQLPRGGC